MECCNIGIGSVLCSVTEDLDEVLVRRGDGVGRVEMNAVDRAWGEGPEADADEGSDFRWNDVDYNTSSQLCPPEAGQGK